MSFSKYKQFDEVIENTSDNYYGIDNQIINTSLEIIEERALKKKNLPFEYFYEDIIQEVLRIDFTTIFDQSDYKALKEDAMECLELCDNFQKLSAKNINSWLQASLKVVDYLVLDYIQNINKETPKKYNQLGIERSRYQQLEEDLQPDIKDIGTKLKALYDFRNSNEHRTKTNPDGTQILIRPNRHQTREIVMKYFPTILNTFKNKYSIKNLG